MNVDYKIKDNNLIIYLDRSIYPLISIKKAMFNYTQKAYIEAKIIKNKVQVQFEFFDCSIDNESMAKEFVNDCLKESLRYDIAQETKNIRELILGRALYTSCIEIDNNLDDKKVDNLKYEDVEDINIDINEIAINWFDINRKEE